MNDHDFRKISNAHEVEEKIFRDGSQLYCSCVAYDVVSEGTLHESLGASQEFRDFIRALIEAGRSKNFIAREKALHRLAGNQ